MYLQITNYGASVLASNPSPTLDVFKLGNGVNYVPLPTDTDIHGSQQFSGQIAPPVTVNANVVRYTIALDTTVGDFDWGEVGYFHQGALFALAVSNSLEQKRKTGVNLGNQLRLDAFLTVVGTNYTMIVDEASSSSQFQMATLSTVDQLPPSNQTTPNAYIISAASDNQSAFQAFTDRLGLWNFDAYQYVTAAKATVTAADSMSVTISMADYVAAMTPPYFGAVILQFITGKNYSICRYVKTAVQSGGHVTLGFDTPMAVLPEVGSKIQVSNRLNQSAAIQLPIATASVLGGIKIGAGLQVDINGVCSINPASLNAVTQVNGKTGVVNLVATDIPGFANVALSGNYNDLINLPTPYSLPLMALNVRGGAKLPTSGNLVMTGEQLDLSFAPVKTVNNVAPDGSGNVNLTGIVIGLVNPAAVTSNADLNNYTTTGLFTITSSVMTGLQNKPSGLTGAATLEVVPNTVGGVGDSVQRLTTASALYWRANVGASWSGWSQAAANVIASSSTLGVVKVGNTLNIDGTGLLNANLATASTVGVVKPGTNVTVDGTGTLNVSLPIATSSVAGIVQIGAGLTMTGQILAVNTAGLPKTTTTSLGVMQVGSGLAVDANGIVSVNTSSLPVATTTSLGVVKINPTGGLLIAGDGSVSFDYNSLPIATTSTFGIMKVGSGLNVSLGTVSSAILTVNGASPDGTGNVTVTAPSDATKLNVVNGVAQGIRMTFTNLNSIAGGGTVAIDQSASNVFAATFSSGGVTWTMSNWPASGTYGEVQIEVINGGTATHTFPGAVKWVNPDGTLTTSFSTYMTNQRGTTTFQTSGTDFVCFWTRDGGANVYAKVL
jgi:hypothetical protein